ncbi:hypothetical protein C8R46DRAFT_1101625 [Mycena filopes]|nr:hypothetical protein C8R46DRAFT_1101625 [Mycena filopes]
MLVDHRLGVFVADSDEKPEKICQWVDCPEGDKPRDMKVCPKCKGVRYCSRACQKSDWRQHKLYCALPPLVDPSAWMRTYYDTFRWALAEGFRLRTDPTNLQKFVVWVEVKRLPRMANGGLSPSPFAVDFMGTIAFEDLAKYTGHALTPSASRNAAIQAEGGIGEGIVLFRVPAGKAGSMFLTQYHAISEIPQGVDGPPDLWKALARGIINGDIPISSLSHMVKDGDGNQDN